MSEAGAFRYTLDAGVSRFTVRAFASGLLSAFGHNPLIRITDFTGGGEYTEKSIEPASLLMKIRTASLTVTAEVNEKDRREIERVMHEEVLETAKHPEIVFQSTEVKTGPVGGGRFRTNISGDLTLHGVTRSETIPAQVILDGTNLRAFGEFTVKQADYAIKLVSVVGGGLRLKDELKCSFDILAHRRDAGA